MPVEQRQGIFISTARQQLFLAVPPGQIDSSRRPHQDILTINNGETADGS
jgi:hypothetical protein